MVIDNLDQSRLAQLVRVESEDRRPVPRDHFLTDYQRELLEYEKAYKGQLYDDEQRCYEWGQRYDPISKSPIPRELWKPAFMPQIGRELVDTQTAQLVGKDKFPTIRVTSSKPLFSDLPVPDASPGDDSTPEQRKERAQANALQDWAEKVFELAELALQAQAGTRWGLVFGEQPMLLRIHGKKPRLGTRNRTWCSWGYTEDDPDQLEWFRETFFFKRRVADEQGVFKDKWFLFLREINGESWMEREFPVEVDAQGKEHFGAARILRQDRHDLGFVPVSIYSTSDRQSMYANGVLQNVKNHIEGYNDRRAGTLKNMQPQWVVLKDAGDGQLAVSRPGQQQPALKPGQLWELEGKSVASFSNQVEGYSAAGEMLDKERDHMRSSGGIIDIPPDNEQSGRALTLRLAPQFSSTDMQRTAFAKGIADTARKALLASHKYASAIDFGETPIPGSLEGITISLDWGNMLPVTPEVIAEEIANIMQMRLEGLMSKQTAQEYLLPLFNIDDIASERARLAAEALEEMERQVALASAAFENADEDEEPDNG